MNRIVALLCAALPAACSPGPQRPTPMPHYTLGAPYQAGGVWEYPRENFALTETGIAVVYAGPHAAMTADGEVFDQSALAAAHPTLQLPAIARLTNLETGRQVLVRINDRGSGTPHRLIAVTRRVAQLLEFPADGVARVRLEVLPRESHAALEGLPATPALAVMAAPRGAVQAVALAAPPGTEPSAAPVTDDPTLLPGSPAVLPPPLRLPATVTQIPPAPGQLYVWLSAFQGYRFAAMQRARLGFLHPEIESVRDGDQQEFRARIGPIATLSAADAVLDQAIGAGVTNARIVVE